MLQINDQDGYWGVLYLCDKVPLFLRDLFAYLTQKQTFSTCFSFFKKFPDKIQRT